jgi:hypothetical protein
LRFALEENFLDDKSNSFQIEDSKLDTPARLGTIVSGSCGGYASLHQRRRCVAQASAMGQHPLGPGHGLLETRLELVAPTIPLRRACLVGLLA